MPLVANATLIHSGQLCTMCIKIFLINAVLDLHD